MRILHISNVAFTTGQFLLLAGCSPRKFMLFNASDSEEKANGTRLDRAGCLTLTITRLLYPGHLSP
jgi:hypothetical protein